MGGLTGQNEMKVEVKVEVEVEGGRGEVGRAGQ